MFMYGDKDWMDPKAVIAFMENFPENHKCEEIEIVADCGHQMPLENPTGTAAAIRKFHDIFKSKNENPQKISLGDIQLKRQNSMDMVSQKYKKPDSDDDLDVKEGEPPMEDAPHIPMSWKQAKYNDEDYPVD